jgi:hypothetical protein
MSGDKEEGEAVDIDLTINQTSAIDKQSAALQLNHF